MSKETLKHIVPAVVAPPFTFETDQRGLLRRREASINDVPIL